MRDALDLWHIAISTPFVRPTRFCALCSGLGYIAMTKDASTWTEPCDCVLPPSSRASDATGRGEGKGHG